MKESWDVVLIELLKYIDAQQTHLINDYLNQRLSGFINAVELERIEFHEWEHRQIKTLMTDYRRNQSQLSDESVELYRIDLNLFQTKYQKEPDIPTHVGIIKCEIETGKIKEIKIRVYERYYDEVHGEGFHTQHPWYKSDRLSRLAVPKAYFLMDFQPNDNSHIDEKLTSRFESVELMEELLSTSLIANLDYAGVNIRE